MATRALDIRGLICPMTWARVRYELDLMVPGDELDVVLDHRPAYSDIRRNAEDLGHEVERAEALSASQWRLVIQVR